MKASLAVLGLLGFLATAPLAGQTESDHAAHHPDSQATPAAAPLSEGEVRKVDKAAGKVTIKHGPLQNLDMPPMTMVFRVKDAGMLDQVKEGDKIKFSADRVDGSLTVTQVQVVP